jgi:hypothetical protein
MTATRSGKGMMRPFGISTERERAISFAVAACGVARKLATEVSSSSTVVVRVPVRSQLSAAFPSCAAFQSATCVGTVHAAPARNVAIGPRRFSAAGKLGTRDWTRGRTPTKPRRPSTGTRSRARSCGSWVRLPRSVTKTRCRKLRL